MIEEDREIEYISINWLEFGCWVMVALTPFLYYFNGPAVSTDQFVVRTVLFMLSIIGGTALTIRRLVIVRKSG